MAIPISSLRESVLLILYDYMLTSDHEGFWFGIPAIQEALPPNASGAFLERVLGGLITEKLVEQGGTDLLRKDLYALTEHGIREAETLLERRGHSVDEYEPAPDSDLILSRIHNPKAHSEVSQGLADLKAEIEKSNSFDSELDGDGDLVETEIAAATTLLTAERVRVSRLKALIVPTLRYLAKKFADQAIGELAKRLIVLIIGLDN